MQVLLTSGCDITIYFCASKSCLAINKLINQLSDSQWISFTWNTYVAFLTIPSSVFVVALLARG